MTFIEKLVTLCTRRGVSPRAVALDIGFDPSAIAQWKRRGGLPRPAVSAQIADYFGVTVEDLLEDTRDLPGQAPVVVPSQVAVSPPAEIPFNAGTQQQLIAQMRQQALAMLATAEQLERSLPKPSNYTPATTAERAAAKAELDDIIRTVDAADDLPEVKPPVVRRRA